MACKYVFNNITYSSKEEFIKEVLEKDFLNQPKTLRVQGNFRAYALLSFDDYSFRARG